MRNLIARLLALPGREHRRVAVLFLFAFGMSGAYVSCRTLADTLFLNRLGADRLPAMIAVAAATIALVSAIYGDLTARFKRVEVVTGGTHVLFGMLTIAASQLISGTPSSRWLLISLYIFAELRGAIGSIQFRTLLNEMFSGERPSAAIGVAAAGSTLSGIICGAITSSIVPYFGIKSLYWLILIMDCIALVGVIRCRRVSNRDSERSVADDSEKAQAVDEPRLSSCGWLKLLATPLTRFIALTIFLKSLLVLMVQFDWKTISTTRFPLEEDLAAYFGLFYALLYFGTGMIQLLVTGRILQKFSTRFVLGIYPLTILILTLLTVFLRSPAILFALLTVARGADGFRRALTDPCLIGLYQQYEDVERRQVIAFIGGWIKPLAESLGGLLLIATTALVVPVRWNAIAVCLIAIAWLGLLARSNFRSPVAELTEF